MAIARALSLLGLASLALLAAGCGGSSTPSVASLGPSTTTTTSSSSGGTNGGRPSSADFYKFAHCMESHGVTVQVGQGGSGISITGKNVGGPQLQKAQQTCQKLLPGGGPKPLTAAQQAQALKQMIKLSRCMRAHGVKNFPDPSGANGFSLNKGQIDPNAPGFQAAAKACSATGPNGKGFGFRIRVAPS